VGFEETQKSSQKQQFPQSVTQNTTHSPSAVAHATRVLLLVQRIATMPPDVLATLFGIFNSTAGKPPSAP
jgi:hypothetical protein